jgi:miniconductance mechanosensitive channel
MEDIMPSWVLENPIARDLVHLGVILVVAVVVYALARWFLVAAIRSLVKRSRVTWDDALVEARVFIQLAHIAPALVVYYGIQFVPDFNAGLATLLQRVAICVMVAVTAASASSFLTAVNEVYSANPKYRHRPIKGYLQVIKIAFFLVAVLIIISTLMDKSPWLFVSGLGAMTAILLLIFKDTILSLVASVQIASNDMIHVGDWIEMPQARADGDVIDVALHTVKVRNWDKTITTIPTHKFIDESFKNWRGMSESGGRRIKRAINIDMNSVRFLEDEEVERFERWALLCDYIEQKRQEIETSNRESGRDASINADIRRLTNVGTLRAYIRSYLHSHPKVHHAGYTLIVRQLAPGPTGLPIEIYCFSNDQAWDRYESIQADIFDHILAIVPEFGLRIFQAPAGTDFDRLTAPAPGS